MLVQILFKTGNTLSPAGGVGNWKDDVLYQLRSINLSGFQEVSSQLAATLLLSCVGLESLNLCECRKVSFSFFTLAISGHHNSPPFLLVVRSAA